MTSLSLCPCIRLQDVWEPMRWFGWLVGWLAADSGLGLILFGGAHDRKAIQRGEGGHGNRGGYRFVLLLQHQILDPLDSSFNGDWLSQANI